MRLLYTAAFYCLLPIVLLRLLWRALKAPAYAQRWPERFGNIAPIAGDSEVWWIHAVSVGETIAAVPLIEELQRRFPEKKLVVTTTTPTGSERVRSLLNDSVTHVYAPYDLPDCLARFLTRVHPSLVIIMETELWPNTIAMCKQRQIPVVLANGRLSERSAQGYHKIAALIRPTFQQITAAVVQHRDDGERMIELGLIPSACHISGNIKFDLTISEALQVQAKALKAEINSERERVIWIAASTHKGEDEIVLEAFVSAKKAIPSLLLILVPRHPERFDTVAQLCESENLRVQRRSTGHAFTTQTEVLLADTMGELLLLYGIADMAFVGGSLVNVGGHNLIEPAAWALPILAGPHLFNFSEVSRLLQTAHAISIVDSAAAMTSAVIEFGQNENKRREVGEKARAVAENNRGALERLLDVIALVVQDSRASPDSVRPTID